MVRGDMKTRKDGKQLKGKKPYVSPHVIVFQQEDGKSGNPPDALASSPPNSQEIAEEKTSKAKKRKLPRSA